MFSNNRSSLQKQEGIKVGSVIEEGHKNCKRKIIRSLHYLVLDDAALLFEEREGRSEQWISKTREEEEEEDNEAPDATLVVNCR